MIGKCENIKVLKIDTELDIEYMPIACGHCPYCRRAKWNEWSLRCRHEMQSEEGKALFITLTYSPKNAKYVKNYTKIAEKDEGTTLDHKDYQDFMKRLRKEITKKYETKIRYFMCGEYGPKTGRAHYHAIIFGINWKQITNKQLEKIWGLGITDVQQVKVGDKQIKYVAGYVKKKLSRAMEEKIYEGRKPPYGQTSQGIGKKWFEKNKINTIKRMKITADKTDHNIPRYYIKLAYKEEAKYIKKIETKSGKYYYKVYRDKSKPMTAKILQTMKKYQKETYKQWLEAFKEWQKEKYIDPEEYWKDELKMRITMEKPLEKKQKYKYEYSTIKITKKIKYTNIKYKENKVVIKKIEDWAENWFNENKQITNIRNKVLEEIERNIGFTPEMWKKLEERGKLYCDNIRNGWFNKRKKLDEDILNKLIYEKLLT